MKKSSYRLLSFIIAGFLLTTPVGCKQFNDSAEEAAAKESAGSHLTLGAKEKEKPAEDMSAPFKGTVVETIDAGRYTYVQVDTGEKSVWVASPAFDGVPGDAVSVPPGLPMADFQSKTLDRKFDMIYFVGAIQKEGENNVASRQQELPKDHPPVGGQAEDKMTHPPMKEISETSVIDIGVVEKAAGGQTVSEIITGRKSLAGKQVRVRAKVVKYTPDIMDKNWLHVRDGSGSEGTNDLIVTTDALVNVGDVVLISGTVSLDRDFGYGLKYPVIIENAEIALEP